METASNDPTYRDSKDRRMVSFLLLISFVVEAGLFRLDGAAVCTIGVTFKLRQGGIRTSKSYFRWPIFSSILGDIGHPVRINPRT